MVYMLCRLLHQPVVKDFFMYVRQQAAEAIVAPEA